MTVEVAVVASEPGSLAQVNDQCRRVEVWAAQTEDVVAITDAKNKLAAIDAYLEQTATEGRAMVAASMRRLEARIGQLIGEAKPNGGHGANQHAGSLARNPAPDGLSRHERNHFRNMADHEDTVERIIAESDDEHPASRRKVLNAIHEERRRKEAAEEAEEDDMTNTTTTTERHHGTAEESKAKWAMVAELAARGYSSAQIAKEIGNHPRYIREQMRHRGIACPGDEAVRNIHSLDTDRIISEAVASLEGVAMAFGLATPLEADPDLIDGWISSSKTSIRSINLFLKELIHAQE